jgi:hypothetical protein
MKAAWAAAVMVACGPRPMEPPSVVQHTVPVVTPAKPVSRVHVPRPDIPEVLAILPDLTEQLRWPLGVMDHPALEPRFAIAAALADPGIAWTELCARGVQHRTDPSHKDELAYLGAWCAAAAHDTDTAVRTLAPLEQSGNLTLATAVPLDLVNVLVADVDYGHADQLLSREHIRDPRVFDLLAAAYFEVGKSADSYQASFTARQLDPIARDDVTCHRTARLALIGPQAYRAQFIKELHERTKQKVVASVCSELAVSVPCMLEPVRQCDEYAKNHHILPDRTLLLYLYEGWPDGVRWASWLDYAWNVRHTWPAEGSDTLIGAALDAAVLAADCEPTALAGIAETSEHVALGMPSLADKAPWVRHLREDPRACAKFHDDWVASHR